MSALIYVFVPFLFFKERLWKTSAAAQIGRQAASTAQLKFKKQIQVARSLAKAVMDFWCLVEVVLDITLPRVGSSVKNYIFVIV